MRDIGQGFALADQIEQSAQVLQHAVFRRLQRDAVGDFRGARRIEVLFAVEQVEHRALALLELVLVQPGHAVGGIDLRADRRDFLARRLQRVEIGADVGFHLSPPTVELVVRLSHAGRDAPAQRPVRTSVEQVVGHLHHRARIVGQACCALYVEFVVALHQQ